MSHFTYQTVFSLELWERIRPPCQSPHPDTDNGHNAFDAAFAAFAAHLQLELSLKVETFETVDEQSRFLHSLTEGAFSPPPDRLGGESSSGKAPLLQAEISSGWSEVSSKEQSLKGETSLLRVAATPGATAAVTASLKYDLKSRAFRGSFSGESRAESSPGSTVSSTVTSPAFSGNADQGDDSLARLVHPASLTTLSSIEADSAASFSVDSAPSKHDSKRRRRQSNPAPTLISKSTLTLTPIVPSQSSTAETEQQSPRKTQKQPMSAEDKRQRFLERNRVAAGKCRLKRKGETAALQEQLHLERRRRSSLTLMVAELESEAVLLRTAVQARESVQSRPVASEETVEPTSI